MINKVILIGNLGRDPEVRHFENGSSVAKFSVATNENFRDKNGEWQKLTEWHDVVCWRHLAERAEKMLKKGNMVFVEGKLTHRKYQDQNGVDRYVTEVVANTFRLLEKRDSSMSSFLPNQSDEMGAGGVFTPATAPTGTVTSEQTDSPAASPSDAELDDDLPF